MIRKPILKRYSLILVGIFILLLGNAAWVLADTYLGPEGSPATFAEMESQTHRGDQFLYTPAVHTYGFFECTVVNVSNQTVNVTVEIKMSSGWSIGPIGGPLGPGGVWIANASTTDDFARGVIEVAGDSTAVRATCISTDSNSSAYGFTVQAE